MKKLFTILNHAFSVVNPTTKEGKSILASAEYYRSLGRYTLGEIYGHYSSCKQHAFDYCRKLESELNGWLYLGGHNSDQFTAFIDFTYNGIKYIAKITKDNQYLIVNE